MLEIFPGGIYEKGIFSREKKYIIVSYLTTFEALV